MKFLDEEDKFKICEAAQKRMSTLRQEDIYCRDDLMDACILAGKAAISDFIGTNYSNQTTIRLCSFDGASIIKFMAIDADYCAKIFDKSDTICSVITISLPENVITIFNHFSPPGVDKLLFM